MCAHALDRTVVFARAELVSADPTLVQNSLILLCTLSLLFLKNLFDLKDTCFHFVVFKIAEIFKVIFKLTARELPSRFSQNE